jgi:transcriptional regulator
MSTHEAERLPLMQGTLDLLILRTLTLSPEHGQGIARAIQTGSQEELLVEHGSLYPALQRLEADGAVVAEWGTSDNNRRARYYRLTPRGRKVLALEITRWKRLVAAIGSIIDPIIDPTLEPAAGPKTAGEV